MDWSKLAGAFIGAVYGGYCYAISKAKNNEDFSPVKFVKTMLIGTILGLSADQMGLSLETVEGMSTVGFFTVLVDKVAGLFEKKQTK
ncbi:MAG: hypothetical protein K6T73_08195 [Candidatus Bathyarchaeota archaeon]|nr:hypothetical protein [Candidatus Bathyarchaeota archaeon]